MYEGTVVSTVLRCKQCNKPFDKESTLKRHGYYCRSRRSGAAVRSRSCISCVKGKVRCDNKTPSCSRCITKAIDCEYPPKTTRNQKATTQHRCNGVDEQVKTKSPSLAENLHLSFPNEVNIGNVQNSDDTLAASEALFINFDGEFLNWQDPDINFAQFLDFQTIDKNIVKPHSWSPSLVPSMTATPDQAFQISEAGLFPNISTPRSPINYTHRSLIHRSTVKNGPQRIRNLMLHTLKSYPLMMLRHNTLPPFIHPHWTSLDTENGNMELLSNCISLVHMISSGVRGSRKLFWNNVRMECERICEEHQNFNRWEVLAAMQALSIYILIRLDEGETEYNNCDFLLIAAIAALFKQTTKIEIKESMSYTFDFGTSWKEWIFQESKRRLAVIYRILNMLVHFEPTSLCTLQSDLLIAPLPAQKSLWEANDENAWRSECGKRSDAKVSFGLAANGELVKLEKIQIGYGIDNDHGVMSYKILDGSGGECGSGRNYWEEWCAGMDGFGGLVMLAASLVE